MLLTPLISCQDILHVNHHKTTTDPISQTTFRTNAAHDRFDSARNAWGEVINASRDLLRETRLWIPEEEDQRRMATLVKAFPITLNFFLTTDGGHHMLKCRDPDIDEISLQELVENFEEKKDTLSIAEETPDVEAAATTAEVMTASSGANVNVLLNNNKTINLLFLPERVSKTCITDADCPSQARCDSSTCSKLNLMKLL